MPELLRHFPKPVLDELVAGRWLPIVGAGLSRNAHVPSGEELPLWDGLGRAVAGDIPGHDYAGALDALSAFEQEFGRRGLVARLSRELLINEARPGAAHHAFCRLRFDKVVTTNLEFLLERGYAELGEGCDVVIDEEQLGIPAREGTTVLLKLHGDLRHPGRLVVTEDDYDGFLSRHPVLATHVASLLIERVPVLIGYSLDDPDLRQLLAMLRDRLGAMLPNAYIIAVDANAASIARYNRRGVKVINLPGPVSRYGPTLERALLELDGHWRQHVLEQSQFTEDRPLEEVATSMGGKSRRLCFFSVPASRLARYREEVFPLAEDAGLVPVSGFDIDTSRGNSLTAVRTLLERSRIAVVDVSTGVGSTELSAAVHLLGPGNVAVVSSGPPPPWVSSASGVHVVDDRDADLNMVPTDSLSEWFLRHATGDTEWGFEMESLLAAKHWRAALIAAMAELEVVLRTVSTHLGADKGRPPRPTLRRMLTNRDLPIDDALRGRLLEWAALRNAALHEGAEVGPKAAKRAVSDVATLRHRVWD